MKSVSLVHLALGLSVLGGGTFACNTDPSKDKAKATVAEAVSVPGTPAANETVYEFSQVGSKIEFVGAKVTGKHDGSLGTFSGNALEGGSQRVGLGWAGVSPKISSHHWRP